MCKLMKHVPVDIGHYDGSITTVCDKCGATLDTSKNWNSANTITDDES